MADVRLERAKLPLALGQKWKFQHLAKVKRVFNQLMTPKFIEIRGWNFKIEGAIVLAIDFTAAEKIAVQYKASVASLTSQWQSAA